MKFFQTHSFAVLALGSRYPKSAWLPAHTCGQQKPKCTVDEPGFTCTEVAAEGIEIQTNFTFGRGLMLIPGF